MSTTLREPGVWDRDGVDPVLVSMLHRRVGEALTAAHVAHEEAGRGRLSASDERALARKLIADELRRLAADAYANGKVPLAEATEATVSAAVLDRLHGLARLQPLLDDPQVRDIHISGAHRVWLNLRDGTKTRGPSVADSDDDLVELIATAARRLGRSERRWDHAHPELNLQLPNGDRLHALMAVSGRPTVTIRRHDFAILSATALVRWRRRGLGGRVARTRPLGPEPEGPVLGRGRGVPSASGLLGFASLRMARAVRARVAVLSSLLALHRADHRRCRRRGLCGDPVVGQVEGGDRETPSARRRCSDSFRQAPRPQAVTRVRSDAGPVRGRPVRSPSGRHRNSTPAIIRPPSPRAGPVSSR